MSDEAFAVDPELLNEFVDESIDSLAEIPEQLIELESNPSNLQLVNDIFRPVHSMKGNAAFFGLMKIKHLAHELETVMDLIRKEKLAVDRDVIDVLIKGLDELSAMFKRVRQSEPEIVDEDLFTSVVDAVVAASNEAKGSAEAYWETLLEKYERLRGQEEVKDNQAGALVEEIWTIMQKVRPDMHMPSLAVASGNVRSIVQRVAGILSEPFEGTLADDKSAEIGECLTSLREALTEGEGHDIIESAWDSYHTMTENLGFESILGEILVEKMASIEALLPDEDSAASSGNAGECQSLLDTLETILSEPIDGTLDDEKSAEVHDHLTALMGLAKGNDTISTLEKCLDSYQTMVEALGFDDILASVLLEKVNELQNSGEWLLEATAGDASSETVESEDAADSSSDSGEAKAPDAVAATTPSSGAKDEASVTQKTMRIAEKTIDTFLDFVGELIVVREMFEHLRRRLEAGADLSRASEASSEQFVVEFKRLTEAFTTVSNDLEKSIMAIRKQSVRGIVQKVPRIVRDVARAKDKDIEVITIGGDLEIDKSIVDTLEAPLVHMVRNAADHGVEPTAVREATGKLPQGKITVSFVEEDDSIVLTVEDDGGGLDKNKLKDKAVEMGLIGEGQPLSDNELVELLFQSGVSTAEEVTDISGRGVGMDVVKRNIDAAGGNISVQTELGRGTTFSIALPKAVTTQIINGFVVSVGGTFYVLPVNRVVESFPPSPDIYTSAFDREECVCRHGVIMPSIRLVEVFSPGLEKERHKDRGIIVVIESQSQRIAFLVDEIVGIQQVVLKRLEGLHTENNYFAGGALMGDGTVSLVIDVDKLLSSPTVVTRYSEYYELTHADLSELDGTLDIK